MIRFTNAPEAYDYSYVETIHPEVAWLNVGNARAIRAVRVTDEYRWENFQAPRYGSGLYLSWTPAELKENVEAGLVEPATECGHVPTTDAPFTRFDHLWCSTECAEGWEARKRAEWGDEVFEAEVL